MEGALAATDYEMLMAAAKKSLADAPFKGMSRSDVVYSRFYCYSVRRYEYEESCSRSLSICGYCCLRGWLQATRTRPRY